MKKQNKKIIGWILLLIGLIMLGYISLVFLVSKFMFVLISLGLIIGGQYLLHKR